MPHLDYNNLVEMHLIQAAQLKSNTKKVSILSFSIEMHGFHWNIEVYDNFSQTSSFTTVNKITWVRQGYMEPVVSNEKTISLMSAPPVAATAAGFAFLAGDGAFSSSFSSTAAAGFWNNKC